MPYSCTVVRRQGVLVVLDVEPEQPDAEPFYEDADFALALLLNDEAPSELERALGPDAIERIAAGTVDPAPYVRTVRALVSRQGSVRSDVSPVARYAVEVTDARWIAHLAPGITYDSYAWSEGDGSIIPDADVWETPVRLPVASFAVGDRVQVHGPASLGALAGRGSVETGATRGTPLRHWAGGTTLHRIAFDHGPRAWAFAESLRTPPADAYEGAAKDVTGFVRRLFTLSPLERGRALHFLALRGGGAAALEPTVHVEGNSARMYALLRMLPFELAVETATHLLEGWLGDAVSRTQTFGRAVPGQGLAAGDTIEGYQFECYAPLALTLGALTLLVSEHPLDAAHAAQLEAVLRGLPPHLFGYGNWDHLAAYPRAACRAPVQTLPRWLYDGYPSDAGVVGLSGSLVTPSETDLYQP